jgi:hypothetical protein
MPRSPAEGLNIYRSPPYIDAQVTRSKYMSLLRLSLQFKILANSFHHSILICMYGPKSLHLSLESTVLYMDALTPPRGNTPFFTASGNSLAVISLASSNAIFGANKQKLLLLSSLLSSRAPTWIRATSLTSTTSQGLGPVYTPNTTSRTSTLVLFRRSSAFLTSLLLPRMKPGIKLTMMKWGFFSATNLSVASSARVLALK